MKSAVKIIAIILVLLGLFLYTAPASLVTEVIPEQSNINISGFQGKAINGSAKQLVINGIPINNVTWELNLLAGLSGTPTADITIDDSALQVQSEIVFLDNRNWAASGLNGAIELAEISKFIPALRVIGVSGAVNLEQLSAAQSDLVFVAGEGQLQWNNAALTMSNQRFELGTINAELGLEGGRLLLDYAGDSSLLPTGTIKFSPTGDYEMTLQIEPSAIPANMQWMARMGKATTDGKVAYSMSGKLRL